VGTRAIVPVVTVKNGEIVPVGSGSHDWGFTPPAATKAEAATFA
jgi:hypothetical protein